MAKQEKPFWERIKELSDAIGAFHHAAKGHSAKKARKLPEFKTMVQAWAKFTPEERESIDRMFKK